MLGYGGRSSRIICGLRRYDSKIVAHSNSIQELVSRRLFSSRPSLGEATISRNRVRTEGPFVDGAKRFYKWGCNNQADELKASRGWKWWMWNLETFVALAFFGGVVGLDICTGSWETVPYTKRRQLLLPRASAAFDVDAGPLSEKIEKQEKNISKIILPPLHPVSVRVQAIARNLIEAYRRKEGDARIKKRWDAWVINAPSHRIFLSPGGKIIISGGILNSFGEDAEIAAFFAPEIGRLVARHCVEKSSMMQLLSYLFILILHVLVSSMPSLSKYFRFPFTRSLLYFITWKALPGLIQKIYSLKMDLEADYIGLMLLASAGYDPRLALKAREKMVRIKVGPSWEKMRTRQLILDMEEALTIYREVMAEKHL